MPTYAAAKNGAFSCPDISWILPSWALSIGRYAQEQARAMLAEDDFTTQPLMAAFEAQSTRQASPSLAVQADDSEFDQFLTILPGAEREASQALQRMMGPLSPYLDEEDLEES